MGELIDALTERFGKEKSSSAENEARVRLKTQTMHMLREHLVNVGDELTFEVNSKFLPYVPVFFEDENLTQNYSITQKPGKESEFIARPVEVDVF